MENFNLNPAQEIPERSTSGVISHAFNLYKGIFAYALLATVLYIVLNSLLGAFFPFDSQEFMRQVQQSGGDFSRLDPELVSQYSTMSVVSGIIGILLSPLLAGVIYIASKYHNGHRPEFRDLFVYYRQNFGQVLLYGLLSGIILSFSFSLCFLPGLFVAPLFMLGYPIVLFENATAIEAIKKSVNIAKENYGAFLGIFILSALISLAGLLLCFVGIILTYPFIFVAMYSAYCAFVGRPRPIYGNI